jgi:hypothetical protein
MAGTYSAVARGLQLSGDREGAADAMAEAISREQKAHKLHSKNSNQIKNREERKQAASQAARLGHAGRVSPTPRETTASYPQYDEEIAQRWPSEATGTRESSGATNAVGEAEAEERQASGLQASGYGVRANDARRDSCFAEEEVDSRAEAKASKSNTNVPEQRTPSPQGRPRTV